MGFLTGIVGGNAGLNEKVLRLAKCIYLCLEPKNVPNLRSAITNNPENRMVVMAYHIATNAQV